MQRLVRGWALYILLIALSAALHLKAWHEHSVPPPLAMPGETAGAAEWWPDQLDAQMLQQLAAEHPRAVALFTWLTMLMAAIGITGMVLGIWLLATKRAKNVWRSTGWPLPAWTFGELARLLLLMLLMISFMPFVRMAFQAHRPELELDLHLWISGSMLFLDLFLVLTIATFALGKHRSMRQALGCPPGRTMPGMRSAARAYVIMFPWLFLILLLTVWIAQRLNFHPPVEPIQELVFHESSPLTLWLTVLLACVVGPVSEELFFRGTLYGALRTRLPWVGAMAVSATLFALIHTNILGFVPIMLLGCVLAYVYEQTGSLASSIAIHVTHNSLLMAMALTFKQLGLAG